MRRKVLLQASRYFFSDGSIISWGSDTHGQITDTPTGTGYTAITGGGLHSLALAACTGTVQVWATGRGITVV